MQFLTRKTILRTADAQKSCIAAVSSLFPPRQTILSVISMIAADQTIFFAASSAFTQSSAALKACSCVMAFSVRLMQSRISCPK